MSAPSPHAGCEHHHPKDSQQGGAWMRNSDNDFSGYVQCGEKKKKSAKHTDMMFHSWDGSATKVLGEENVLFLQITSLLCTNVYKLHLFLTASVYFFVVVVVGILCRPLPVNVFICRPS